jgi:hypothetical protein
MMKVHSPVTTISIMTAHGPKSSHFLLLSPTNILHTKSTNVSGSKMCSEANWNMLFLSPRRRILLGILTVSYSKIFPAFYITSRSEWRTRYYSWLWHYATSRRVAGSVPYCQEYFTDIILPVAVWPWGRLSLQ